MARKKQQDSNIVGLIILGVIGFGIFQFGIQQSPDQPTRTAPSAARAATPAPSQPTPPLSEPRYVNVASLNVRHTPSTSGPLIGTLPQGTQLSVIDRQNGWLLVGLSPTLEGWVSERLTTTRPSSAPTYVPPAGLRAER